METNPQTVVAVLHECTANDTNGNPRRCYTAIGAGGQILRVEDEGYAGTPEWVRDLRTDGIWDVPVEVTPRHYRNRLRMELP